MKYCPVLYEIAIVIFVMIVGSLLSILIGHGDVVLFYFLKFLKENGLYDCQMKEFQLFIIELELEQYR